MQPFERETAIRMLKVAAEMLARANRVGDRKVLVHGDAVLVLSGSSVTLDGVLTDNPTAPVGYLEHWNRAHTDKVVSAVAYSAFLETCARSTIAKATEYLAATA